VWAAFIAVTPALAASTTFFTSFVVSSAMLTSKRDIPIVTNTARNNNRMRVLFIGGE
jgi:hypothetical protein